jgi:hypothetical protein
MSQQKDEKAISANIDADLVMEQMLAALIEVEQMVHAGEMNEGTMAIVRETIKVGMAV